MRKFNFLRTLGFLTATILLIIINATCKKDQEPISKDVTLFNRT